MRKAAWRAQKGCCRVRFLLKSQSTRGRSLPVSSASENWIESILDRPERLAMPIMTSPGLALTGQTVRDLATSGEAQFACMKALGDRYHVVAAQTMMDLSVEAEAFGCAIKYNDNEVPTVAGPVITEVDDLDRLTVPQVGSARTGVYLDAAGRAADCYLERPVLAGMIGPYSLAVRLRDMTQVMLDVMLRPDFTHRLLGLCTEFLIQYAKAFGARGADGVLIAEPAAGLLSFDQCEEFSSRYVRRIVEAVQGDDFAVILHNCGRTAQLVPSMVGTGARGLHFGNAVDMMDILPQVPGHVLVFGNIDPVGILKKRFGGRGPAGRAGLAGANGQVSELRSLFRMRHSPGHSFEEY